MTSTIDAKEVAKFTALAAHWWNKEGDLRTLHDLNPIRLQFIKEHTQLSAKSVLDLGCGGGILSEAMALSGAQVCAIDADAAALNVAKEHALQTGVSIDYRETCVEDLEHEPFNLITCMEMLEHVNNPQLILEHCARLIKAGGYLFLSTINRNWQAYAQAIVAAEYILGLLPRQTHDYHKFIQPAELAAMARSVGFKLIALQGLGYNPLARRAYFCESVQVNYLMCCQKEED